MNITLLGIGAITILLLLLLSAVIYVIGVTSPEVPASGQRRKVSYSRTVSRYQQSGRFAPVPLDDLEVGPEVVYLPAAEASRITRQDAKALAMRLKARAKRGHRANREN